MPSGLHWQAPSPSVCAFPGPGTLAQFCQAQRPSLGLRLPPGFILYSESAGMSSRILTRANAAGYRKTFKLCRVVSGDRAAAASAASESVASRAACSPSRVKYSFFGADWHGVNLGSRL
jgi:hypothetical protein